MVDARLRPMQIESREGSEEPALEQIGIDVPPEQIRRTEEYLREDRLRWKLASPPLSLRQWWSERHSRLLTRCSPPLSEVVWDQTHAVETSSEVDISNWRDWAGSHSGAIIWRRESRLSDRFRRVGVLLALGNRGSAICRTAHQPDQT